MDWAAQQQVFESIAAIASGAFALREPGAEPEDLVLSVAGAVVGLLLAWWGVNVLRSSMPEGVPRVAYIGVDRVLGAASILSLLTGVLFGLVPALQLSRPDLTNALKDGARTSTGGARQRMRSALVVAEVAFAVVLLVGAALFIGSFMALMRIDPGFDPKNVLTAGVYPRFRPVGGGGAPPADVAPQFVDLADRIARIPGVLHASVISGGMPLGGSMSITTMTSTAKEYSPAATTG